eukprot:4798074-Prymnesium_polylepis.1
MTYYCNASSVIQHPAAATHCFTPKPMKSHTSLRLSPHPDPRHAARAARAENCGRAPRPRAASA